ncbi:MAG: AAA family ATPase, partial [Anaerolineae bacterium]|nr:AAA family ATPase [Anaerolineae bacterium]
LPDIWLNEVRRLTPEIADLHPNGVDSSDLDGPGAPARFFEGIAQAFLAALAGMPPGVLLLDDVQWADEATLDLLAFLVRRLRGQPLMILATMRSEHSATADRVRGLLVENTGSESRTAIFLDRLGADAVGELVAQANLHNLPPGSVDRLLEETEGLPLFLVEYLASVDTAGMPAGDEPWQLPRSVR